MVTTIQIDEGLKKRLDNLKVHARESYNELILRLVNSSFRELDRESLMETIDILSDPGMMRGIAKGLDDYSKGKFKKLRELKES